MKIRTWRTYKKNDKPKMYQRNDAVFSPMVIEPTLRNNGFNVQDIEASEVFLDGRKPRELVVDFIKSLKKEVKDVVYHYWWGRSGVLSIYITIGYKT